MFRDFKSHLGLDHVQLEDEQRLARLLLGFQIAYLILCLIGLHTPERWQKYFSSRSRSSFIWLALHALKFLDHPRHAKVWNRHIWPVLLLESG
jgi:hypothetical protein